MATVTVYRFRVFDPELQQWVTAPFRATEPAIQSFGGTALRDTALSVDTAMVAPTGVERMKARQEAMRDALTAADAALKSAEAAPRAEAPERRVEAPASAAAPAAV